MAEDRKLFREAMGEIGLEQARSQVVRSVEEALEFQPQIGYPVIVRPSFTLGGTGGGIARNEEELRRIATHGLDLSPAHEVLLGGVAPGLEGIRDGGGARRQRQLHHRLLDREPRSDGGAHWGFDHGGTGADPDGQGVPADARCLHRGAAQDRRGHRGLQRAVRGSSGQRAAGDHRNEPACFALLGACLQGHRLPDRQGGGPAGRRLHAGRAPQRHHGRRDAVFVRADPRLHRDQDSSIHVREIPAGRAAPDHPDEVGRGGDGDWTHLPGIPAEGVAQLGDRAVRAGSGRTDGSGGAEASADVSGPASAKACRRRLARGVGARKRSTN